MRLWNLCHGKGIPWWLCCVGWVPHSVDGVGGSFQLEQHMHNLKISPVNSQPLMSLCTTKFSKTALQRRELFVPKLSVLFSSGVLGKGVGLSFEHLWRTGVDGGCVNHEWCTMGRTSHFVAVSASYSVVSQVVIYLCTDPDSHSNNHFYLHDRSRTPASAASWFCHPCLPILPSVLTMSLEGWAPTYIVNCSNNIIAVHSLHCRQVYCLSKIMHLVLACVWAIRNSLKTGIESVDFVLMIY